MSKYHFLNLAKELISRPSITPNDYGCQDYIIKILQKYNFSIERYQHINSDNTVISNLYAQLGKTKPLFVFAGHTDVVPPGEVKNWRFPPFTPTIKDGFLFGRGSADMKSSIACFLDALTSFLSNESNLDFSIGLLITSDEEGIAHFGTKKVVTAFKKQNRKVDYCLVGEPTTQETLGDTIKIGRRGSISLTSKIIGVQGHIAYQEFADNAAHKASMLISELLKVKWDNKVEDKNNQENNFPATSFQISNLNSGTGTNNIIPGSAILQCNWRFSNLTNVSDIKTKFNNTVTAIGIDDKDIELEWEVSGEPYSINKSFVLLKHLQKAITKVTGKNINTQNLSTGGGISDGRFIKDIADEVIEFGPNFSTIHKIDEKVSTQELRQLTGIYKEILYSINSSSL